MDRTKRTLGLSMALAGATLAGCAAKRIPGPPYPTRVERGPTLDIQVFRKGSRIEIVNATPTAFARCRLWLNGRYSNEIDGIAVGESLELSLRSFRDEFGDVMRAGGFFATDRPEPLVLAEIQEIESGAILGLIVVQSQAD